jgi:hypothetical protein
VRRSIAGFIASLLLVGVLAPSVAAAQASASVPKVVVIVGPSGAATDRYRSEGHAAAVIARQYTPDVIEVFSPNATWPAVRKALQGASLVIYMGHGNGWPSPYRSSLYPPSQNGFGLNPSAGSGDDTHQYFGESRIAASIHLAKDAVVLLNHLCYASGNSEPGLAEGTLDVGKQRVDNFAAGFIQAGASAVVAEAYASPNYMLRSVLGGHGSIESAWRSAPSKNGHVLGFESVRSPGYVAEMDPERSTSGFSRSIVLKSGLASSDVLRNGRGSSRGSVPVKAIDLVPSLATRGITLKAPSIAGGTNAGGHLFYRLPFTVADRSKLPRVIQASVRWDPLDPQATPPSSDATPPDGGTDVAPDFGLISPEHLGDVVAPTALSVTRAKLSFHVAAPKTPGRYRLTVTLHDSEGVAFDAATQAMVPTLIVRITGEHDAGVVAPATVEVAPGGTQQVTVWVANLGATAWGHKADPIVRSRDAELRQSDLDRATHARLVGTWIALGGIDDPAQQAAAQAASATPVDLPAGMAPRAVAKTSLTVFAPSTEGDYLLVLDILTPDVGSLSAQGVEPTIVRVHVSAAAITSPAAAPGASVTAIP